MEISAEEFIRIWQTSESREEVIRRTGMTSTTVSHRVKSYRARGVPLKIFKLRGCYKDWDALRDLARSLAPKPDAYAYERLEGE